MKSSRQSGNGWESSSGDSAWLPLGTFVLWLGLLAIGLFSFAAPRALGIGAAPPPAAVPPPSRIEIKLDEGLDGAPAPSAETTTPRPSFAAPSPLPPASSAPAPGRLPPLPAFAAPPLLELKARSVAPAPKQAVAAREKAQPRPEQPRGPILLLPGIGEGAQKMPRYPRLARERGQEGEIRAEITVDKNGRMTDVRLSSPCRWELLNREVLRVIREEWRFSHGEERRYTMTFQFLLREKKP